MKTLYQVEYPDGTRFGFESARRIRYVVAADLRQGSRGFRILSKCGNIDRAERVAATLSRGYLGVTFHILPVSEASR